jgi:hypothetical protein
MEIIEVFPRGELGVEATIVGAVRSFHFSIASGGAWFDIDMLDAQILDVPVKAGLEFMAIIGAYGVDSKGEARAHLVNELDGGVLVMSIIDLQGANAGGIIHRRVLKAALGTTIRGPEF